jgi:hypothetical protein
MIVNGIYKYVYHVGIKKKEFKDVPIRTTIEGYIIFYQNSYNSFMKLFRKKSKKEKDKDVNFDDIEMNKK